MADHNSTEPQQFTAIPPEKDTTIDEKTANSPPRSSTSFISPANQVDDAEQTSVTASVLDENNPMKQSLREILPTLFVLPHLMKKNVWIILVFTSVVMMIYIWLYLGALWSPLTRVKNVEILLYNDDAGFDFSQSPAQVVQLMQSITHNSTLGNIVESQIMDPQGQLSHIVLWADKTQEPGWDLASLTDYVEKGNAWGLVYIPANFSNNFLSYAPSNSGPATTESVKVVDIQYIYDQGRSYSTHSIVEKYVSRSLISLYNGIEKSLLTSAANQTLLQTMYPSLWVQTIQTTEIIINPVLSYGQSFSTYVIFIVLYIGSIIAVVCICKYIPTTIETVGVLTFGAGSEEPIRKDSQIPKFPALRIVLARYSIAMLFSFFHTIVIWMVPQVLHGHQMSSHYNAGVAFVFIWLVGISFISILFFFAQLLTVDGFQIPSTMFMIMMFTTSGGIIDWIVMPGFFRIGFAFPFTYGVKGLKAIYFGSLRDKMWINWLVVVAWIVVPSVITMIMARSEIRLRREKLRRTASVPSEV
ncbi:hypothetical protein EDD21DRAFT_365666 [Dissophora ornata]|nr:hypothetical protein BGZ58_008157 [Dissophora ornata]KAI8604651.1 hypothetical protein EDD21DRAFT_365666 [Dissophora ornata]